MLVFLWWLGIVGVGVGEVAGGVCHRIGLSKSLLGTAQVDVAMMKFFLLVSSAEDDGETLCFTVLVVLCYSSTSSEDGGVVCLRKIRRVVAVSSVPESE